MAPDLIVAVAGLAVTILSFFFYFGANISSIKKDIEYLKKNTSKFYDIITHDEQIRAINTRCAAQTAQIAKSKDEMWRRINTIEKEIIKLSAHQREVER